MEELFRLIGKVVVENEDANKKIDETTDKAEKGLFHIAPFLQWME